MDSPVKGMAEPRNTTHQVGGDSSEDNTEIAASMVVLEAANQRVQDENQRLQEEISMMDAANQMLQEENA